MKCNIYHCGLNKKEVVKLQNISTKQKTYYLFDQVPIEQHHN